MKLLRYSIFFSLFGVLATAACVDDHSDDCAKWRTCSSAGDGDGDTGGTGGDGDGDGDTGGNGGSSSTACDPKCIGDTPICNEDAETCVECLETEDCEEALCDTESNKCVQCLENADCIETDASLCDAGTCSSCTQDDDCTHLSDTPVCDEVSGTCVECTSDTEEELCGEFSCSSLTHTCTTTTRGLLGTCEACEADSECATDRKCIMDQFEGADVGYFCFLEQGTTGCGDMISARRPYRTIVETTSLDGTEPQNFCLPPNSTTCQGIKDTQSVNCATSDECGLPNLDDGYCPDSGDGAGFCSYLCGGALDCASVLECGDTPLHCNPQ